MSEPSKTAILCTQGLFAFCLPQQSPSKLCFHFRKLCSDDPAHRAAAARQITRELSLLSG